MTIERLSDAHEIERLRAECRTLRNYGVERMNRVERLESALRGVVDHWREFGDMMVHLSLALTKHVPGWPGATDEQLAAVSDDIITALDGTRVNSRME